MGLEFRKEVWIRDSYLSINSIDKVSEKGNWMRPRQGQYTEERKTGDWDVKTLRDLIISLRRERWAKKHAVLRFQLRFIKSHPKEVTPVEELVNYLAFLYITESMRTSIGKTIFENSLHYYLKLDICIPVDPEIPPLGEASAHMHKTSTKILQ